MSANQEQVRAMICGDTTPLARHVFRFADPNGFFSPKTVTAGLRKMHGTAPYVKGPIIAAFNSSHAGNYCPFLAMQFRRDEQAGYGHFLHLGTTRIWNADGSINETRWRQFENFVSERQVEELVVVTKSKMKAYLELCTTTDAQELETGRNTNAFFSSAYLQGVAATAAWDEVYERLTCGWKYSEELHDHEPYITLDLIRLFFTDSNEAFFRAERRELPVAKPLTFALATAP